MQMRADHGIDSIRETAGCHQRDEKRPLALVPHGNTAFFIIANAGIHNKAPVRHFQQRMYTLYSVMVVRAQ